jgi:hypothetical protein
MKIVLDFFYFTGDTMGTSLVELAIRSQVSLEPGLFFAQR